MPDPEAKDIIPTVAEVVPVPKRRVSGRFALHAPAVAPH